MQGPRPQWIRGHGKVQLLAWASEKGSSTQREYKVNVSKRKKEKSELGARPRREGLGRPAKESALYSNHGKSPRLYRHGILNTETRV